MEKLIVPMWRYTRFRMDESFKRYPTRHFPSEVLRFPLTFSSLMILCPLDDSIVEFMNRVLVECESAKPYLEHEALGAV